LSIGMAVRKLPVLVKNIETVTLLNMLLWPKREKLWM
jgi:hypothetical protein